MMNYQQTLDYLFARLPMFSRIGADAIKKDLNNTRKLCEILGNPEKKIKTIHVAGTNGKGSVSHMLAAILQMAGYKTGLYTSPHLYDFRERIKVNGEMISEEEVISFTEKMRTPIETIEPSFFEITVALAFEHFVQAAVDIAVIETGLGGRLDSTNVIEPELSIITNIGWDHMQLLGNTLEAIAFEKAGIIKKETPVVIGEASDEIKEVFKQKAEQENAVLHFSSDYFHANSYKQTNNALTVILQALRTGTIHEYAVDLPGLYQVKNIKTVLTSVEILRSNHWMIAEASLQEALKQTRKLNGLLARWEKLHERPDLIIDVAHNEDGVRAMCKQLEETTYDRLHVVVGMVKDKDIESVLALMPKDAQYYFTRANIPRALPEEELLGKAAEKGLHGKSYPNVNVALKHAMTNANENDLVLVCGSVFVAGEVDRSAYT